MLKPSGGRPRREPCAKCGLPVFIAERLNVGKLLYHRTCFRCARCNSQLTLANYYETETENQFCCETCPDEEQTKEADKDSSDLSEKILNRSLSDEEKSAGIQKFEDQDDYSFMFETALENPEDQNLAKNYTLNSEQSAEFTKARSRFITSQLAESEDYSSEDEVPDLPKSEPPSFLKSEPPGLPKSEPPGLSKSEPPSLPKSEPPDLKEFAIRQELIFVEDLESEPKLDEVTEKPLEDSENTQSVDKTKDLSENLSSIVSSEQCESCDSGFPSHTQSLDSLVHSAKVSEISDRNQPETANQQLDTNKIVTKENKFPSESNGTSLVKSRMRLFENKFAGDQSIDDSSNKNFSSSAEKKFIHKVPSEEEQSSTGLNDKKLDLSNVEFDSSISASLLDEENAENHTEQKNEKEIEEILPFENSKNSIIIISDSSKEEQSVSAVVVEDTTPVISDTPSDKSENKSVEKSDSVLPDTPSAVITVSDSSKSEISPIVKEEYPEDLNPFGDDDVEDEQSLQKPKTSLNPFGEDEDEEDIKPSPKPAVRRKIKARKSDFQITGKNEGTPEHLAEIRIQRISCNPFEDDDEEESKKAELPTNRAHTMKVVSAPRISLNPFWSDGEEPEDEDEGEKLKPVPLPRNSRSSVGTPEPKPRKSGLSLSSGLSRSAFGSNTSLSSAHSSIGPAGRKKKQAPKPPMVTDKQDSAQSSLTSSPSPSVQHSPKSTPRLRKAKKAPLPPSTTSTPFMSLQEPTPIDTEISPIANNEQSIKSQDALNKQTGMSEPGEWEKEKIIKDELNRNRQSQAITSPISSTENSASLAVPNKSTYGKWKRRKGPAPSRPIPQRRNIKPLPMVEIKRELEFIEIQQQGLEKQGVRVEQIIREKCEGPNVDLDSSLPLEVEDLILQLFELVNEKNELFRKQAELMYLRRQQRLEEEYADLEYQIRCLMIQPEANKTDSDKAREEELINRLVEVVERRNEIVECLEMDRVREAEEDDSINNQLNLYASKREEDLGKTHQNENKQKKKGKKEKKFKFKTSKKVDVDKDIDECESCSTSATVKDKEKKKKKFNIF